MQALLFLFSSDQKLLVLLWSPTTITPLLRQEVNWLFNESMLSGPIITWLKCIVTLNKPYSRCVCILSIHIHGPKTQSFSKVLICKPQIDDWQYIRMLRNDSLSPKAHIASPLHPGLDMVPLTWYVAFHKGMPSLNLCSLCIALSLALAEHTSLSFCSNRDSSFLPTKVVTKKAWQAITIILELLSMAMHLLRLAWATELRP